MKIAIHRREGSFSDRWIEYCELKKIPYKIVNCFSTNIILELQDCSILMWHWHHHDSGANIFAKQLILSLEQTGIKVFPNVNTSWHFDDKLGQKYLLEGHGLPLINSYLFYDKASAIKWAENTVYPKIFKLRIGAGSSNVKLIGNKRAAKSIIKKAFSKGFNVIDRQSILKYSLNSLLDKKNFLSFRNFIGALGRLVIKDDFEKFMHKERGYVYFQDFLSGNNYDTRIIVVGKKAFGLRRFNRKSDFRASGSGLLNYDPTKINLEIVKLSFEVANKLQTQCIALDFIIDPNGSKAKIIEISFGFSTLAYDKCPGYWNEDLIWNEESFNPQYWMIENTISSYLKDMTPY